MVFNALCECWYLRVVNADASVRPNFALKTINIKYIVLMNIFQVLYEENKSSFDNDPFEHEL